MDQTGYNPDEDIDRLHFCSLHLWMLFLTKYSTDRLVEMRQSKIHVTFV